MDWLVVHTLYCCNRLPSLQEKDDPAFWHTFKHVHLNEIMQQFCKMQTAENARITQQASAARSNASKQKVALAPASPDSRKRKKTASASKNATSAQAEEKEKKPTASKAKGKAAKRACIDKSTAKAKEADPDDGNGSADTKPDKDAVDVTAIQGAVASNAMVVDSVSTSKDAISEEPAQAAATPENGGKLDVKVVKYAADMSSEALMDAVSTEPITLVENVVAGSAIDASKFGEETMVKQHGDFKIEVREQPIEAGDLWEFTSLPSKDTTTIKAYTEYAIRCDIYACVTCCLCLYSRKHPSLYTETDRLGLIYSFRCLDCPGTKPIWMTQSSAKKPSQRTQSSSAPTWTSATQRNGKIS